MTSQTSTASTAELRKRLQLLLAERALAAVEGLSSNALFMADLEDDITATRAAYVGAAVTEIATLRGVLGGRQHG